MSVNTEEIYRSINQRIRNNTHHVGEPIMQLNLIPLNETDDPERPDFVMQKQDIFNLFQRYGRISEVILKDKSTVLIRFVNKVDGVFAMKHLNGYVIRPLQLRL